MGEQRCGLTLDPIVFGKGPDANRSRVEQIDELHRKGKEAIPALLQSINNAQPVAMTLANPFLSNRTPSMRTYCGVVGAYMIELVLGRNTLLLSPLQGGASVLLHG
jgi:hypothetical protein